LFRLNRFFFIHNLVIHFLIHITFKFSNLQKKRPGDFSRPVGHGTAARRAWSTGPLSNLLALYHL
jgi:hypothetical protein